MAAVVSPSASQHKGSGFMVLLAEWGLSVWHLHVLPSFLPCARARFLLMSADIQVGFNGYSKLPFGVNVCEWLVLSV